MPNTYNYPTNFDLRLISQDLLPALTMQDPIFTHFPIREVNKAQVIWEQLDNYQGLQNIRGIDGQFSRVVKTGATRFSIIPGYYGEYEGIDEIDLTELRPLGNMDGVMDATDLVLRAHEKGLTREINRIKNILWTLAALGTFSVSLQGGGIAHTDTYATQTYTPVAAYSDHVNSAPIADFRAIKLLARGHGVNFGGAAQAYANLATVNDILENANPNDLGKKLFINGSTVVSLDDVNKIFLSSDLPSLMSYDEGYISDGTDGNTRGSFQLYIPYGKIVVFGKRVDNSTIGEYQMTRNASNPNGAPGGYDEVIESERPPKTIDIYRGHNGGPTIEYPSAIVRIG